MELINQKILDCLTLGEPIAIATIMTSSGSTPRTSGSKMVMLKDRTIYGTIGGGMVEAMVMDSCLDLMEKKRCRIVEFTLNRELADGLDMVCGGALKLLIETIAPTPEMISLFQAMVDSEKERKKVFLVSKVEGFSQSDFTTQKALVLPDGTVTVPGGMMALLPVVPQSILDAIEENRFPGSSPVIYNHGLDEFIIEHIQIKDKIYIFGAGHVGLQLARMAHITDFETIIVDDREEFANRQRFPNAQSIHVVDFDHAFDQLSIDKTSYIVILTRGHLHDQTVLEAALKTDAAYVGMIGSRTKRDKIYANLEKKGISRERLNTVYSPIGLNINSETPAEIAVSIIGQIIQVRGGR